MGSEVQLPCRLLYDSTLPQLANLPVMNLAPVTFGSDIFETS